MRKQNNDNDTSIWSEYFFERLKYKPKLASVNIHQRKYYQRCQYYIKKLGLTVYSIEDCGPKIDQLKRVEICEGHEYYDVLKNYWGESENYVGLNTGEYDTRWSAIYDVLKQCNLIINAAKGK